MALEERGLDDVVDEYARIRPDAESCYEVHEGSVSASFTYENLREMSLQFAGVLDIKLKSLGIEIGSSKPLGVCMDRGFLWYSVYIACVRLCLPIAPLAQDIDDLSASTQRNENVLEDLKPVLVIVDERSPSRLVSECNQRGVPTICVSELGSCLESKSYSVKHSRNLKHTPLAYVYTGGTTRASKCVKVSHAMAMHEIDGYPRIVSNIGFGDRVLQHSSTYWGATFLGQLNIALAYGASVAFVRNEPDLTAVIEGTGASVLGVVPSQLQAIAGECKSIKTVFTWGEKLSRSTANKWKNRVSLVELLVSSEYWLSMYALNGEKTFRILNSNCPDAGVVVRSESTRADGEASELLIGGACVTPFGYTDEVINQRSFVKKDGMRFFKSNDLVSISKDGKFLSFLGRSDSLIKIGGEWKDLFLIEQALKDVEGVSDCCILDQVVHVVLSHAFTEFDINQIRSVVNEQYLRLRFVHSLPRNSVTGKIDRSRLLLKRDFIGNQTWKKRIEKTLVIWIFWAAGSIFAVSLTRGVIGIFITPIVGLFFMNFEAPQKFKPVYKRIIYHTIPAGLVGSSLLFTMLLPIAASLCIGAYGTHLFLKNRESVFFPDKLCLVFSWIITFWVGVPRQLERWFASLFHRDSRYRRRSGNELFPESPTENKTMKKFEPFPKSHEECMQKQLSLQTFTHSEIFLSEFEVNEIVSELSRTVSFISPPTTQLVFSSDLEQQVANILLTAVPAIGIVQLTSSLSSINSLSAVEITNHIRDQFDKDVRVTDVLNCVSFSDLIHAVESAKYIQTHSELEDDAPRNDMHKCQLWGWSFPCTWVFEFCGTISNNNNNNNIRMKNIGQKINFRALVHAVRALCVRHPALQAVPIDPSVSWMNETLVVVGLLRYLLPSWKILHFIGKALFNCWNRVKTSSHPVRVNWKGLDFFSESDLREYLIKKRRHANFTPPLEVDLITLHSACGPARQFVRMYVSHAFSDGSCVIPLLKELNELYSATVENREHNLPPAPPSGLSVQERRLETTLCRDVTPDSLYACYNMDMCDHFDNTSFGRIILLHESFVLIAQAAAKRLSVPIDVLFLSAIVCALARLWSFRTVVEMALVVPLRDGPHEADVIGFLADQRNLDVPLDSDFGSLASVVQTIHFLRKNRAWTIPEPFSNCQRTLVNIVQASFPENAPFKQELLLQQNEHKTGTLFRPMELYVEQVDLYMWTLKARCRMREYSEEKLRKFCDIFKNVVTDLLVRPNSPLHTNSS